MNTPRDFVLVHGAWHGGWCWAEVAALLERQGRRCFAPTLRGLAQRAHQLTPQVDADTHVDDVASLVEALDLHDVTLALHSYAGLLGPALLARLEPRLRHIAWIEAVIPSPGQCMLDLTLPEAAARYRRTAQEAGEGWRMPPPDAGQFHLPQALRSHVAARLTAHPFRSFAEPVRAAQADALGFPGSYLMASDRDPQPYRRHAAMAQAAGWPVHEAPGGHLLMLTQPAAVADFLTSSSSS